MEECEENLAQHDRDQDELEQLNTQQDRSERSYSDEIARKDQELRGQHPQNERSHSDEIARRDQQFQDAQQKQNAAAKARDRLEK
ncbi:MAG: hypothetical protein Q9195_006372 [Heterodermia aff. obscurata]